MQFEYTNPQTELEKALGGFFCINAFGPVQPGDDVRFNEFLERVTPPPRTTVYLDSGGGDVEAAINIGRAIRDNWFETSIGRYLLNHQKASNALIPRELLPGQCMSAATLIFLGGKLRHFPSGSKFGVHQFSFRDPSPDNIGRSQVLSAKIALYTADMGVSPDFLRVSSSVQSAEIKLIDEDELRHLRVVTGGETDVTWTVQAQGMLYVRGERDSIFGHHKIMLGYAKGSFLFYALIEAQGRQAELTEFPLVEIVLNGEQARMDISERCGRVAGEIYVNVFAKITKEEARAIVFSDSLGVHIRASMDAPVFLGIAAMSTVGGREQLETFYGTFCEDRYGIS